MKTGILSLLCLLSFSPMSWAEDAPPAEELFPADLLQISSTSAFSKHVLLVDKKERKLLVFARDGETVHKIQEIPADIGKNDGNKEKANDARTPEGIYFFRKKLVPPQIPFSTYGKMAFTTDYPNVFDQRDRKTGSGIWLHSIPETVGLTRGSRGCVVIRNDQLEQVDSLIELGQTPMIIYDKIEYISKAEHDRRRKELGDWLEAWRTSWQAQDMEKYLANYDEKFHAPGFTNLKSWTKHKKKVSGETKDVSITLSQPFLLLHKDQLIVKTLQKYQSSTHTDYGVKTIHALKTTAGYKIIREEWEQADERGQTPSLVSEFPRVTGHPQD